MTKAASILCVMVTFVLTACGGGGGGGGDGGNSGVSGNQTSTDNVAATLHNLNVDTTQTARVDEKANPLPDSFAPLGAKKTLNKNDELFIAGLPLTAADDDVNIIKFQPGISNVPGVPDKPDSTKKLNTSPLDQTWKDSSLNASAAGDVDGDGYDEIVEAWWDSTDKAIRLKIVDDQTENFAESPTSVLTTIETPSELRVICGDFNGDGTDDIAIAYADDKAGTVTLDFLIGSKTATYSIDSSKSKTYTGTQGPGGSTLGIELAVGQLDLDASMELGVVINETWGGGTNGSPGTGRSDYHIYDDQSANFAEIRAGRVTGDVGASTYNAVTATIAMGDVDGDAMDEVVLAGLTRAPGSSNSTDFPVYCDALPVIQYVLDDAHNGFANLGTDYNTDQGPSSCEQSGNNGWTAHIWANRLDIDGDQIDEIQVNGVVYEDFKHAAHPWDIMMVDSSDTSTKQVEAKIPFGYMFKQSDSNNGRAQVRRDSLVMAAADVNADGKEDILVYNNSGPVVTGSSYKSGCKCYSSDTSYAVTIWGFDPETGLWGKKNVLGTNYASNGLLYAKKMFSGASNVGLPMVVPANVDKDSMMLKFSKGSHRIVFSEPIVHAVLSAPPCYSDGSQVTDVCTTAWGSSTTSGTNASISQEVSVTYHTGVSGGVSVPEFGSVKTEVEQSVGVSLKAEASYAYELTKLVTYTTGPMEDTVVATVVPYDQYTYKILSHPVYPDLVGKDVVISLPRSPRTMQIDRQFYNDSLVGIGDKIDSSVLSHTIGVPKSYPTYSQMLGYANAKRIGPKDIGASEGSQSVSISESQVAGLTTTLGLHYETTVKTTEEGELFGFTVGESQGVTVGGTTEASLGFTIGSGVTYTGTVGDMPPATFSLDKAYSFGMFVYQQQIGSEKRPADV
ncbi:MAG: VCBS repeat-containing protein, partial [Gammaproteobacteria bacterium]